MLRGPGSCRATVRAADTAWARMMGLLGRTSIPADEGLLLRPAWSIHTWGMRFPIDVVFIDRDERVLRIVEAVRPWRLVSLWHAHAVVELAAGRARALGLREGRRLDWV